MTTDSTPSACPSSAHARLDLGFEGSSTSAYITVHFEAVEGPAGGARQYQAGNLADMVRRLSKRVPLKGQKFRIAASNGAIVTAQAVVGSRKDDALRGVVEIAMRIDRANSHEVQAEILAAFIEGGASPDSASKAVQREERRQRLAQAAADGTLCPKCHGDGGTWDQVRWSDGLGGARTGDCPTCEGRGYMEPVPAPEEDEENRPEVVDFDTFAKCLFDVYQRGFDVRNATQGGLATWWPESQRTAADIEIMAYDEDGRRALLYIDEANGSALLDSIELPA